MMPHKRLSSVPDNIPTLIADNVPCLLAYLDAEGCYQFVNRCYERWFGLRPDDMLGKHFSEIVDDASYEKLKPIAEQIYAGQPVLFEGKLTYRRGGERWVSANYVPDIDERGQVRGSYAFVADISPLKEIEAALRESEQRFKDFAEIAADWFWEMDAELRFTQLDERYQTVVDIPPEQILGHTRQEIYGAQIQADPERWEAHLQVLAAHRPFRDFEFPRLRQDGRTVWVSVSGKPMFDDNGDFIGYRGVTRDITEHKAIEAELKQSEHRFQDFAESSTDWLWEQDEKRAYL